MSQGLPHFDAAAVMARLRAGDEAEIALAYSRTFSSAEGRFVLAHILAEAGVGAVRGPRFDKGSRDYFDGKADGALEIMNRAGLARESAVMAVITDQLEGSDHERKFGPTAAAAEPGSVLAD